MRFQTYLNPAGKSRPSRPMPKKPALKKLPVTDGPFAETKELVGGSKEKNAA